MKKKVNIILPGLGESGGIFVVRKYAELLNKIDWDVTIYCPIKAYNLHRYKSNIKNILHQGYCTIKTLLEIRSKKYCSWVWKISDKTIRDADFTVATMWATAFDVYKLIESKGDKIYLIQDYEIWDCPELAKGTYLLPLRKIVISTWINKCLKQDLKIGPFPIVYNGLDINQYQSNCLRSNNETTMFLMLNHKLSKKGVSKGLEVFQCIKNKYSKVHLRMFGMCDDSNLPDYVEYYQNPTRDKISELYSISDIFIFPSLEEGWGLTPLEAMACGCVVVGTETGFVLDLGIHRENMMISQPGNVSEMVHNIEEIMDNPLLLEKIRNNAYKLTSELNWEDARDKLVDCLLQDGQ